MNNTVVMATVNHLSSNSNTELDTLCYSHSVQFMASKASFGWLRSATTNTR